MSAKFHKGTSFYSYNVTICYVVILIRCYNNVKGDFMVGLKIIREKKNLNQQKVAMDLNISREALSYYENGKQEPSLALLLAMSQF